MFPPSVTCDAGRRDGHHLESSNGAPTRWRSRPSLRAAGLRVEVYPDADKIGKQFKYASRRGIPFVAVVGDDEAGVRKSRSRTWPPANRRCCAHRSRALDASQDRQLRLRSAVCGRGLKPRLKPETWLNNSVLWPALIPAARCAPATSAREPSLLGWVHRVRDLGALLFLDVRDRARHHAGRSSKATRRCSSAPSGCAPSSSSP